MSAAAPPAPELDVAAWLNADGPLSLQALRGRVVLLHAFQMLCPACVRHGLPQATAAHQQFGGQGLAVIGLHTVFEHHAVMGREALDAFVHEYRLRFPIAIDRPAAAGPVPRTMARYALQGTPSTVLIDRGGSVRLTHFGVMHDLALGAALGHLLGEAPGARTAPRDATSGDAHCTPDHCAVAPPD